MVDQAPPADSLGRFVEDWFVRLAEYDASRAVRGLREYGSLDLAIMGSVMRDIGVTLTDPQRQVGTFGRYKTADVQVDASAAILFYLQGKIARAFESVRRGELPAEDTRLDMRVYCAMLEWIATRGAWAPPAPEEIAKWERGE